MPTTTADMVLVEEPPEERARRIIREAEAEASRSFRANKEARRILDDAMRQVSSLGLANSVTNPEKKVETIAVIAVLRKR